MTDLQAAEAKKFAEYWKGKGYEKGESQKFWIDLLEHVYGVKNISEFISFEDQVHLDHTSFIDGYIPSTKVLIEQKGIDKDLKKAGKQSDGTYLTPFQQAKRYIVELPVDRHPRWVITCNFAEFWVYDMNKPNGEPEIIKLEDLPKEYYRLNFLVDTGSEHIRREMEVSIAAGEIVGLLYDAFSKEYVDPTSKSAMHSLNVLCVRLVFCLYAENAGIFDRYGMFHDYMASFETRRMRSALIELFKILDTPEDKRDKYLDPELAAFPYVNGGLFSDEDIEIPNFTDEIRELLLEQASSGFNWKEISPTIFGAVFESTLNPETRRSGGMHYTSIENIHKVIDPLFLDDLKKEFAEIRAIPGEGKRNKALKAFQEKLANLKFLDPAAGSGNFLTETYLSLRRLENEVISELTHGQMSMGDVIDPIKVTISQFYGIEINDFAVTVAKTALWIAESQMMKETEEIVFKELNFLPLKTNAYIIESNALTTAWETIVPKTELSYIMGNPPFVGYSLQSKEQKNDILSIFVDEKGKPYKTAGKIDYVAGWYFKAAQFMQGTNIRAALVSTNSITQGEQVAGIWKPLYERFGIHIDFAHRTFRWDSEASLKAHVHCVIVGFSVAPNDKEKVLFEGDTRKQVKNINFYLTDGEVLFIEKRRKPLCNAPEMLSGNRPADGGFLLLSQEERDELISKEPKAEKFIKRFMMGYEFINNVPRYCLWLVGVSPKELRECPSVLKRVALCKEDRENSPDAGRRKLAETPTLFREQLNPDKYIALPVVSSEQRKYIPMGYLNGDVIAGNKLFIIPNADLYNFGVLTSNVHMAWMRAVCGRLEMRYSYSKDIVYNNFPWCSPTAEQKAKIEKTAQGILDARALYPNDSLADLYDEAVMPPELRKAHQYNDIAVMQAYGFSSKEMTESGCVAELMRMYREMVEK
ncbi:MAG: methylase [Oscillospiraceae bacterium]|nr:methylase [Oscillospiraceae bacterium]